MWKNVMTCVWCHLNIKLGGCRRTVGTACKNCILLNLHPCKYIYKLFCACMLKKKDSNAKKITNLSVNNLKHKIMPLPKKSPVKYKCLLRPQPWIKYVDNFLSVGCRLLGGSGIERKFHRSAPLYPQWKFGGGKAVNWGSEGIEESVPRKQQRVLRSGKVCQLMFIQIN